MGRFGRAALAAVAAFGFAPVASAADMPTKAPVAPVAAPYSWTGFYVGGNIGYSWGHGDANYTDPGLASIGLATSLSGSQKIDGVIGGGQFGFNWQANNIWVFGLEADFQGSGEKGSFNNSYPDGLDATGATTQNLGDSKILWFGTVRGRVGVLVNPTLLLYGTGGLAYGRISTSGTITDPSCGTGPTCSWSFGNSATKVGWTIGAGVEGAIPNTRDWTWKLEYLYIDFGSISGNGFESDFGTTYSWSTKVTDNILRVGVNYRFH
jgi:outer membrane immunogenic protein